MEKLELSISNFLFEIDEKLPEQLMSRPGEVFCEHCGMDFWGRIYFKDGLFHEDVYVYHRLKETISGESLDALIHLVCKIYGYD